MPWNIKKKMLNEQKWKVAQHRDGNRSNNLLKDVLSLRKMLQNFRVCEMKFLYSYMIDSTRIQYNFPVGHHRMGWNSRDMYFRRFDLIKTEFYTLETMSTKFFKFGIRILNFIIFEIFQCIKIDLVTCKISA